MRDDRGADGNLQDVTVSVNIDHTFIRDLQVELVAPSGHAAMLHNRMGGSADDIHTTYAVADTTSLENLLGQSVRGDWHLRVKDLEGWDHGVLKSWEMRLVF